MFYHGVTGTCNGLVYSMGAVILDINEPSKVKYRSKNFVLTPEEWYEERGFVNNVLFPCATLHDTPMKKLGTTQAWARSKASCSMCNRTQNRSQKERFCCTKCNVRAVCQCGKTYVLLRDYFWKPNGKPINTGFPFLL